MRKASGGRMVWTAVVHVPGIDYRDVNVTGRTLTEARAAALQEIDRRCPAGTILVQVWEPRWE